MKEYFFVFAFTLFTNALVFGMWIQTPLFFTWHLPMVVLLTGIATCSGAEVFDNLK